jgi:pimeloyl-ACP methyl ester carboxylesterase
MAALVLVHGAWHGGWCWRRVSPILQAAGHQVFAPSLTGLGDRAHLLTPQTDLDTHVQDIVNLLEFEDLTEVVLVGHSYGGMVITGVAGRVPGRLRHLVYLDAFVPAAGESLYDLLAADARAMFRATTYLADGGRLLPPPPLSRWGVTADQDVAWMAPRVRPQPASTFEQTLRLPDGPAAGHGRTYISCLMDQKPHYRQTAARLQAKAGWVNRELEAGHDAFVTAPRALACLLDEAAAVGQGTLLRAGESAITMRTEDQP